MIALFRHDITILPFPAFNTQTFHDVIPLKPMDTTPKRAMLIVNPVSGTRDKAALPDIVGCVLSGMGCRLEVRNTKAPSDASAFTEEAVRAGFDVVVAAGGDGTVDEVASSLRGTRTALAIIPCGSGNGLARTLGIPPDFTAAARLLSDGKTIACDNGLVNGRPFFCTCGMGFDAEVSRRFASERRRGRMTYVKNAILDYLGYAPQAYALSIGGRVITENAFLIAVCNASQYGNNAYIAPKASLTDGLLDVIVFHTGSLIRTALAGVELFTGHLDRNMLVDSFRVSEVSISRLKEGAAHIDGEPVELGKRLDISVEAANIRIVVPASMPEFKPIISPLRSLITDISSDIRFALGFT